MNTINNVEQEEGLIFQTWEERLRDMPSELTGARAEGDEHWLVVADMPKAYRRFYERLAAKEKRKE